MKALLQARKPFTPHRSAGFSLVEMLVVIAVIGVVTGIVVFAMKSLVSEATAARAKHNAQNLATVGAAAQAVGFVYSVTTREDAVRELAAGVNGTDSFANIRFAVPVLNSNEITAATAYLDFLDGELVYTPDP